MTTISELKRRKSEWLDSTFSKSVLKKQLKLSDIEIGEMRSEKYYGKIRYNKQYVACYLDLRLMQDNLKKDKRNIVVKKKIKKINKNQSQLDLF